MPLQLKNSLFEMFENSPLIRCWVGGGSLINGNSSKIFEKSIQTETATKMEITQCEKIFLPEVDVELIVTALAKHLWLPQRSLRRNCFHLHSPPSNLN